MHTPAPWRADQTTVYAPGRHADSVRIADCRALLPDAELRANVALIAAAPDLLENLHQLVNLLESIGHDCTPAREVIARATGA